MCFIAFDFVKLWNSEVENLGLLSVWRWWCHNERIGQSGESFKQPIRSRHIGAPTGQNRFKPDYWTEYKVCNYIHYGSWFYPPFNLFPCYCNKHLNPKELPQSSLNSDLKTETESHINSESKEESLLDSRSEDSHDPNCKLWKSQSTIHNNKQDLSWNWGNGTVSTSYDPLGWNTATTVRIARVKRQILGRDAQTSKRTLSTGPAETGKYQD